MNKVVALENALRARPHEAFLWSMLVTFYTAELAYDEALARKTADGVAEQGRELQELTAVRELMRVESPTREYLTRLINREVGKPDATSGAYQLVSGPQKPTLIPGQPTKVVARPVEVFVVVGAGWLMNEARNVSAAELLSKTFS